MLSWLLLAIIGSAWALDNNYESQRLVKCLINDIRDVVKLHGLRVGGQIDLWTESLDNLPVNVTLRCEQSAVAVVNVLLRCQPAEPLAPVMRRHQLQNTIVSKGSLDDFFDKYRSYDEMQQWLKKLPSRAVGKLLVRLDSMGKSVEGRDLTVVHITKQSGGDIRSKRMLWVSGGQHAREWIAPASVLFLLDTMIGQRDPTLDALLERHVLVVAPLINPDGYEYSRLKDRLWRKNRTRNSNSSYGVDLNRNWAAQWGSIGASQDPNSDIYCGKSALSEPETRLTAHYIRSLPQPVKLAGLDVHSYGQKILRNYGYTMDDCKDEALGKALGDGMARKASAIHGATYESEKSAALYPTGGGMDDWFYMLGGLSHGFTVELRDDGRTGFLLPAKYIRPTGDELVEVVKQLLLGMQPKRSRV